MKSGNWFRYFVVFVITAGIFFTAFYFNNVLTARRAEEVRSIQESIAIDILAAETQFALLKETSCENLGKSVLSEELGELGSRLTFMEEQRGVEDPEVARLKLQYSLLEIKDYLLMSELTKKCDIHPVFILYFYTSQCDDCERQGYVLTRLRDKYPQLRVYTFDYNLDLSALQTLVSIMKVKGEMPALVIDGKTTNGFKGVDELEAIIPGIEDIAETTTQIESIAPLQGEEKAQN